MPKLTGSEIESLSDLLLGRLDRFELETVVYSSTGDRLYDVYVAPNQPLLPTIQQLVDRLNQQGTLCTFLAEVHARSGGRPEVQDAILAICPMASANTHANSPATLVVERGGKVATAGSRDPFAPGFQRNVRPHLAKLDVHIWLEKLARAERQICRIEIAGNPLGTGFLVGRDAVLTNWHVVEVTKQAGRDGELACRFDYLRLAGGQRSEGIAVPLQQDGVTVWSPYSPAETSRTPDQPLPTPEQLDYALLRLSTAVGEAAIDGAPRGWVALPSEQMELPTGAPLLILQHPDGAPMKLALDTDAVIGKNANGTRLRYKTNTDSGSSGSPCFSMDWDLVALHHYGDPAWSNPVYNQGIPIALIREDIGTRGLGALLGLG